MEDLYKTTDVITGMITVRVKRAIWCHEHHVSQRTHTARNISLEVIICLNFAEV